MTPLKTQAIQTALMGDWTQAILLNQELLADNPNDIDTLNRLGFAYMSSGNVKDAKMTYQKVLAIDIKNPIALRNIKRLSNIDSTRGFAPAPQMHATSLFIEEPGKTKVIDLLNVADKKVLSPLRSGENLSISIKRMKIFLLDGNKQYIGMLPDDLSKRLIKFMDGGNLYEAYIKTVNNLRVTVFVREVKRATKYKNQPSFPSADKTRLVIDMKGRGHGEDFDDDEKDYSNDSDDELL